MKDLYQYGNRPDDEWEVLPWIPDPRPPFNIWVKPEQIAPFFLIPHYPYAISLLLKINDGFCAEEFTKFDSDEDVFCVYSQYIDDLMMLAKMIKAACYNENTMRTVLGLA